MLPARVRARELIRETVRDPLEEKLRVKVLRERVILVQLLFHNRERKHRHASHIEENRPNVKRAREVDCLNVVPGK